MSPPDLYEADFHAWSAAQAEALRRLAGLGGNAGIDWENLIEEVESLGRSERHAVESLWIQALVHLLKLTLASTDPAVPHWRSEIAAFLAGARRKFAPSMRPALAAALDGLWTDAVVAARLACAETPGAARSLPDTCPLTLEDLLTPPADRAGIDRLLARLEPQP